MSPITENRMEKNMGNQMETGIEPGLGWDGLGFRVQGGCELGREILGLYGLPAVFWDSEF